MTSVARCVLETGQEPMARAVLKSAPTECRQVQESSSGPWSWSQHWVDWRPQEARVVRAEEPAARATMQVGEGQDPLELSLQEWMELTLPTYWEDQCTRDFHNGISVTPSKTQCVSIITLIIQMKLKLINFPEHTTSERQDSALNPDCMTLCSILLSLQHMLRPTNLSITWTIKWMSRHWGNPTLHISSEEPEVVSSGWQRPHTLSEQWVVVSGFHIRTHVSKNIVSVPHWPVEFKERATFV